jgi:hypothetical protein
MQSMPKFTVTAAYLNDVEVIMDGELCYWYTSAFSPVSCSVTLNYLLQLKKIPQKARCQWEDACTHSTQELRLLLSSHSTNVQSFVVQ